MTAQIIPFATSQSTVSESVAPERSPLSLVGRQRERVCRGADMASRQDHDSG
jgi:hypothetical protein